MRLLKEALRSDPWLKHYFSKPLFQNKQIESFAYWWDNKTNAKKAVEAVWGKK